MRVVLREWKIGKEKPGNALVDETWIMQTVAELSRAFLYSEVKLVSELNVFLSFPNPPVLHSLW
jgi:hypothetical protein